MNFSWESKSALSISLVMLATAIYTRVHRKPGVVLSMRATARPKGNLYY